MGAVIALSVLLSACGSGEESRSEADLGDDTVLEGTVSDELPDLDALPNDTVPYAEPAVPASDASAPPLTQEDGEAAEPAPADAAPADGATPAPATAQPAPRGDRL